MKVFEFDSYKDFIQSRVKTLPHRGRGELQKIALHLRIHSTRLSQVLRGDTQLSPEQGCALCSYWGMSEQETEYFLALIHRERAGTTELKRAVENQLSHLRARNSELVNRLPRDKILGEKDRATFYSNWQYSGVRLASSLPQYQSREAIARYFGITESRLEQILQFLLSTGLCVEENGRLQAGPRRTHVEAASILASQHHSNWRLKALQRHDQLSERELAYSGPMSIGPQEQRQIREILMQVIEKATQLAVESEADRLSCLNIDWFEF